MNAPFPIPTDALPVYTRTQRPGSDIDAIARRHLPLVRRIAWHIHGHMSSMVDVEDLVQVGLVALVEAVPMFEDRGSVTFEQYLSTRLRGAMIDELRRQATISRGAMKRRRDYAKTVATLTVELGRPPVPAEIADRLGVPLGRLRTDYADVQSVQFDSIDDVYTDEAPWFMDDGPDAFEALAEGELRSVLIEAIAALPEREAQVVQLYYVEELNLEEIGQVLGVGAARICQIKKAAHERLRKALARRMG
jgi:RNA polymerase sigma factor for flagellar operon FliA